MEFHIPKNSDSPCFQDSFSFSPQELADIPCPDDICTQAEDSPQEDDNELLLPPGTSIDDFPDLPLPPGTSGDEFPELPLPPGTSGDEFPIPLPPKQKPLHSSNHFSPSLPPKKALETTSNLLHSESENFNILPLGEDSQQKDDMKADEVQEVALGRQADFLDEGKNSPSKMDSDEENQDFTIAKPKVLGKEQAKKRLMAFSLSKQPTTSFKKQNKAVTPAKNKEKPPNPNKGTNVQEQFRATISAIEEEKKKMFQNMPSYLLLEMSELAKSSHSSMSSSIQLLEKLKSESADLKSKENSGKDGSTSSKPTEGKRKRSFHKSRSRSKEKKPRRSRSKRRSRSRSRTKRSHSRSRRRSYSRGRSRRSRDKNYKTDNKDSRENQSTPKKKSFEDWKSFKASGSVLEANESETPKTRPDESKSRRDKHKRSRSPSDRPDFKPIFNYLNKGCNQMTSLQAKPADPGGSSPVFLEKTIKYTRTKPILCWSENPSRATEFYMSRQMLLENCDETTGPLLLSIIENKKPESLEGIAVSESPSIKTRPWYPREDYLLSTPTKARIDLEGSDSHLRKKGANTDDFTSKIQSQLKDEESSTGKEDSQNGKVSLERKISLVNDSYLSDEEEQMSEMAVGEGKVHIDVKRVKVRSRWDSDYEGENSEKDTLKQKHRKKEETSSKMEIDTKSQVRDVLMDDFDVAPCQKPLHDSVGRKSSTPLDNLKTPHAELPGISTSGETADNLVSEYEQFLKMVSVDSSDDPVTQKEKVTLESKPKADKSKAKKSEKSNEEVKKVQSAKLGATDWDQESDHEEKSVGKKMQFSGTASHDEFLILRKDESADVMLEKTKKKSTKKKTEKLKPEKKKLLKKSSKAKKKKFEDSFSEDDSSSESDDSDSDSDSDESASSSKKKKKKITKAKKKSKKGSSSESDSDSGESKAKKKKQTKKKGKKKKSSSSDDNDEVQKALLKQLDFKKQLIMKKIEEIDSISDKSSKKKEKDSRGKKKEKENLEETDLDKYIKSGKKKKTDGKVEKDKKKVKYSTKKGKVTGKRKKLKKSKSSSESYSDSESSDDSRKKKKAKKAGKRKRYSSESSDSEEKSAKGKSKSSNKASKKKKAKRDSSSSGSEDSDDSSRDRKKAKKENKVKTADEKLGKMAELGFKDNLLLEGPDVKSEDRSGWESQKVWKKPEGKSKKVKEEDDWETSSSPEDSEPERRTRESSWDEEFEACKAKPRPSEDNTAKADSKQTPIVPDKELTVNVSADACEPNNQLSSEALKTSLSNFSFNENSFCSFGQELSRDFFLADRSYSNSGNVSNGESFRAPLIEPRPFQSVSKDSTIKKPADSELYSPGYSDSDLSEAEMSKSEKPNSNVENVTKEDVYDPLNCDSDGSAENNPVELSSIPLPRVPDILLPGEAKKCENVGAASSSNSEGSVLKDIPRTGTDVSDSRLSCMTPPVKSSFTTSDFTPVAASQSPFTEETNTPTKRQLMSVKGQQKLISKAAAVFQDESDEENIEPVCNKEKISETTQSETSAGLKEKNLDESKSKKDEKHSRRDEKEKEKDYGKKRKKDSRDRSRERSSERDGRRRRSRSRDNSKSYSKKASSPRRRRSRTPEINREKREIRSDSFEIEPLKGAIDSNEVFDMVQPIPVLTGLEAPSSEGLWSRSLVPGCEFPHTTDTLIDHAESFDIYPSEESSLRNRNYDKDYADHEKSSVDKSRDQKSKKERRKSRSRSYSPRKKLRSKSPERRKSPRNRSPRRKSASPKRRDKSPFSPRRRSPKRKSPSRRYKISRSPDKRRKSPSRSPRKRRGSPSRRSRSASPRKYRSPKHRDESPRKKDSPGRSFGPRDRFSPRDDVRYSQTYPEGLQNRIPVIGATSDDIDMELSPSAMRSPFEGPMGFPRHLPDSSVAEPELYGSFYEGEYTDEFGVRSYPEEVGVNNLITVKNHDMPEKVNSPERLSLDQRIELELGVQMSNSQTPSDQYQMPSQVCPPFQEMNSNHFPNSYNCENTNISNDNFYQNQNVQMNTDFNGQYFNGHQQQPPPGYGSFQQYPNSQPSQNSVLQVGNIVEVVPTLQHAQPPPPIPAKAPQIMQVGNVLQVVPSQKATVPVPSAHSYGPDASPMVKTQKATAVVAPSSIVPTPNPEAVLNPLIKAIQLEREKRRKEKEKRKAEREARRKARQLRREAKLMSVNEKLKKSVQNEGLMLGQEVEDDELLDGLDVPSPPIPVEIITVSSISALPPAGKGILITAGFMPKPPSEKKEVKFADGVCPGEGTSTSGGEDIASPPPKPKLPKEKRFKKKKTKVKKKVKVQIIRQIIQEDDDDEDDLSPPPPPPGDPPLVFFAKFPFAGDAQFPVYQTQTTTTTLTTVQYPAQTFE